MPKRKLVKPSQAALEAITRAREGGIPITEEEARKIRSRSYRVQTPDLPFGATLIVGEGKDGERRFWTPDQLKGPGRLELPLSLKLQELERDLLTQAAKLRRRPPTALAAKARTTRSKRSAIEQAWREHGLNAPHAAKLIAYQLHVSASYVRKIGAQMRQSEGMP